MSRLLGTICVSFMIAGFLLPPGIMAQVTEIIDATGDGAGNPLDGPEGIAVDGAGSVYVGGAASSNAFKITNPGLPTQTITEIIDATGDGSGNRLSWVFDIAVDDSGNAYVPGYFTDNAFQIIPGGVITEIIDGSGGDGVGNPLRCPAGIAVDSSGTVYVTGYCSDNAFKITDPGLPTQTITEIIDATGDGSGNPLDEAQGVAVDGSGNVYVTGRGSHNAFRITPGGVITEIIDATGDGSGNTLFDPLDIEVDALGNVYVAGRGTDNVFKIADPGLPTQIITEIIDATGDGGGNPLNVADNLAVGATGSVYVTGLLSDNAFKITDPGLPTQTITEIIDATGDGAGNPLDSCRYIAVDATANVYVTGTNSDNAFKIQASECYLVIGDGPGSSTFFEISHLFETQVGPAVEGSYPVLLENIPEFVLPTPTTTGRTQAPALGNPGFASFGTEVDVLQETPDWMMDGLFAVQVLMWNPQVFPAMPEQHTAGIYVWVMADGTVRTVPYGTNQGGMEILHEIDTNAAGQKVIRFPFSIPGF